MRAGAEQLREQVGDRRCTSFTFLETSKRCLFHANAARFELRPAASDDFSTRAFQRFCFPGECSSWVLSADLPAAGLKAFADCAEFLAFRDFSLDLPPKEVFEGLPSTNEGLSACLELCVLSQEFRCRSALFDQQSGLCLLFDEHSLSRPAAFREHHLAHQLYFENGCVPAQAPAEPAQLQQLARAERITPVKLDFRKIGH